MSAPYISAGEVPRGFESRAKFDAAVNAIAGDAVLTDPSQEFYFVEEGFAVAGCAYDFVTILFCNGSIRRFPVPGRGCI